MSTMLKEIYDALKEAGASEEKASAAAIAVAAHSLDREHLATLATKADLEQLRLATKADLAELKADIIKWMAGLVIGSMVAMTGIFAAIVKLL
jgi:hypothetical protein